MIFSWALYDTANQFFVLNIISLYFVRWITLEKNIPEIFYGFAFGFSTFLVAVLSPVLGAIADITGRHRPGFIAFTLICILFTICLSFTQNAFIALIYFALANLGCQTAIIFYNALMLNVTPKNRTGLVSGIGKVFGYLGAIIALAFIAPQAQNRGYPAVFFLTGVLFLLFSLPAMVFIKDKPADTSRTPKELLKKKVVFGVFARLGDTFFTRHRFLGLRDFLKAVFCTLCVINVCMLFMSVYITKVFKLPEAEIIKFILFATVFALLGSFCGGIFSDRIGHKKAMVSVLVLWLAGIMSAGLVSAPYHWVVGVLGGISLGATWVILRALAIELAPERKIGEIFGLFNLMGYLAAIVGPLTWGFLLIFLAPWGELGYRVALICFAPFLVAALIFMLRPLRTGEVENI